MPTPHHLSSPDEAAWSVVAKLDSLENLSCTFWEGDGPRSYLKCTPPQIDDWKSHHSLKYAYFHKCYGISASLTQFHRFSALRVLNFYACGISNDAFGALVTCLSAPLECLGICGNSHWLSDAGLAHLRDMSPSAVATLRVLRISPVTDSGLQYLSHLTSLESLDFSCTDWSPTGTGLTYLSKLPRLVNLDLAACRYLTDLSSLKDFRTLRSINFCESGADASFIQPLAGLPCLEFIDVSLGPIDDACLLALSGVSTLKAFRACVFSGASAVTDTGLAHLSRCRLLQELEMWDCAAVTNDGLAPLWSCSELKSVNVCGWKLITDDAVLAPAAPCTRLESIHMSTGGASGCLTTEECCAKLGALGLNDYGDAEEEDTSDCYLNGHLFLSGSYLNG